MPEQPPEVQRINWSSCFAFTQVFRTFKMTLHPSKLGLALAAILAVGLLGRVLDGIWSGSKQRPLAGEVNAFWQEPDIEQWRKSELEGRLDAVKAAFAQVQVALPNNVQDDLKSATAASAGVDNALKLLKEKGYERINDSKLKAEDRSQIAARFNDAYGQVEVLRTCGIFESLWDYETAAIRQFVGAAAQLKFTDGMHDVLMARQAPGAGAELRGLQRTGRAGPRVPAPDETNVGAVASLVLMARGVQWLVWKHPWYALIFCLVKLLIFAYFGGAICRMAAMNFARDERIPLKTALAFARRKLIGFATAPLLPLGMIVGLGVVLFFGSLILGTAPGVGGFIAGLLLFLALAAGFVMALVLIGFLGGGSLMWPTIAVEGSDSFDAMSRSYSYVYSRPWKAALYALVATVYGAVCYLFVHFFAFVMLWITRLFVGLGMIWTSRPGTGLPGGTRIDSLWPMPTIDALTRDPLPFAAAGGDTPGQWLVQFWVGLVALLLAAFLVTFYFCASTVIYYLLRREVDATDLEDVYSEDVDEEQGEHGPAPADANLSPAGATGTAGSTVPLSVAAPPPDADAPPRA